MMGDINWRRAFAISSLIFALLLVCGSIYLHLRQKHHLGRLNHENKIIVPFAGVDATPDVNLVLPIVRNEMKASSAGVIEYYNEEDRSSEESEEMTDLDSSNENHRSFRKLLSEVDDFAGEIPAAVQHQDLPGTPGRHITEACLQCICETITQCQPSKCAGNEPCGVFHISRPYWIDGGRLRLSGDESRPKDQDPNADYANCVNNAYCSARTIVGFINKYARDCNGDRKIDCRDYIALHVLGPDGCGMGTLSPLFTSRMEQCIMKFS